MQPQAFIFIGRSGGGKGTQADLLMKRLAQKDPSIGYLYIQTGQEFRNFIQGKMPTQLRSAEYYKTDKLQPDFLAIHMWVNKLVNTYVPGQHLIFDGTPRKFHEAGVLDSVFSFYGLGKAHVIYMNVTPEESLHRLLIRKRMDDAEESIKKRLSWYEKDVAPTVEWYRTNPAYTFHEIDGMRSTEEIHADIAARLGLS